ncbi:unnamed protein product, partial [Ectocarpus sp. 12 AP-2014]
CDVASRRAHAVSAPPIPKPQDVEVIHVQLFRLRQVHQYLSLDQHAPVRGGTLSLDRTARTTTAGCRHTCRAPFLQSRNLLPLGCGFHRVHVEHWRWRWRRCRLGRLHVELGDDRLQVLFGP